MAKIFDGIAYDTIEDYDFYEFMDLDPNQIQLFSQKLLQVANQLSNVKSFKDLAQSSLCSNKTTEPYIKLNNGFRNLIASDEQRQNTEKFYQENFDSLIQMIILTYQQLGDWLIKNGKNGVSILGI